MAHRDLPPIAFEAVSDPSNVGHRFHAELQHIANPLQQRVVIFIILNIQYMSFFKKKKKPTIF